MIVTSIGWMCVLQLNARQSYRTHYNCSTKFGYKCSHYIVRRRTCELQTNKIVKIIVRFIYCD